MILQPSYKRELLNRLRTVEGHVRAITRMVEDEQYCIDILRQSLAVQGGLERFNRLLLEHHLRTCFVAAIASGVPHEQERVIGELLDLVGGAANLGRQQGVAVLESVGASEGDTETRGHGDVRPLPASPCPPVSASRHRRSALGEPAVRPYRGDKKPPRWRQSEARGVER